MLSTVVLVLDLSVRKGGMPPEVVARSLSWLVSAAVAGLVRDVVLACPPSIDLADFADQAGCGFVQGATERDRLREALGRLRGDGILILVAGYGGDRSMIDELEVALSHPQGCGLIRVSRVPASGVRRLTSFRSPIVGLVAPRASLRAAGADTFKALVKRQGKATTLAAKMHRLF